MYITFLVRGLGEYTQGYAFAKKLQEKQEDVLFVAENTFLAKVIQQDGFQLKTFDNVESLKQYVEQLTSDALFLCNSHTTYVYNLNRPQNIKKVFSLDSNWLFNNQKYAHLGMIKFLIYEWIDRIYAVFPKSFFERNLKPNGGHYEIDESMQKKIFTPGFIPSGTVLSVEEKKTVKTHLGIDHNDLLLVTYFSRPEFHSSTIKDYVTYFEDSVFQAVSTMNKSINVFNPTTQRSNFNYQRPQDILSTERFDSLIFSADFVVMHFGYGTLPKIFHNQTPVICFIPRPDQEVHSNLFELQTCIDNKAIEYFYFDEVSTDSVRVAIENLLEPASAARMKTQQEKIFAPGEENALKDFYAIMNTVR